ncbi:TIGR01459 family HAD-type hydrolase, partial [Candidatus Pelagibacter sp.]|nr:TIGR01459 family HAD-type hydrolase [Candidatus Pelagibacter sp.]
MTKDLNELGVRTIANQYDLFFIDLWGVVHNGIELYDNSIYVLEELNRLKKELILLTNAPRPNDNV